ncbi:glycosyltransferase [Aromatoleum evansii]|uniref:glycosyltransferase n=1 Tax=Aromatoleum evansii TaxID=59406 RepID=UPI00145C9A7D|nr:glycosyltransferase [Aromatoleum evansii]NMG29132.1 glycosyltransferase [Aromatoleum evansii]
MAEREIIVPQSCILFATADWDEPYWTNKQHCAKSLAELGAQVLYVESVGLRSPKAGSAKDWGRLWKRLCKGLSSLISGAVERSPGIFVLSPLLVPAGHRHPFTRSLNRWLLRASIARTAGQQHFRKPLVWTYHPFMLDAIEGMDTGALLYHCVDDLAAVPGMDAEAFRAAERILLQRADVVFATSPSLAEHCRQHNANTHFLPNVVDAEHFGRALEPGPIPEDLAGIPEPRLCYHGVLSDFKIDFQLLIDVARMKPEWSWVFIGEEREGQKSPLMAELARLPNVHFLGYKPYAELPDYLRGVRVGLLPSLINDYTRGMFPMKYYEYLAAGLPIAATPLDFTHTHCAGLRTGLDVSEFAAVINDLLNGGRYSAEKVADLVAGCTWIERTLVMLSKLGGNKTGMRLSDAGAECLDAALGQE